MEKINPTIPEFIPKPGLTKELDVKGIYLIGKVIRTTITGNGTVDVECGFPPKVVIAYAQDSTQSSSGSSDFTNSYAIRNADNAGTFETSEASVLVSLTTMSVIPAKRLFNGFSITVSGFSGGNKNISFTCFQ